MVLTVIVVSWGRCYLRQLEGILVTSDHVFVVELGVDRDVCGIIIMSDGVMSVSVDIALMMHGHCC